MSNDVEKRWHDPRGFRDAARYVGAVVAVAVIVVAACLIWAFTRDDQCVDAAFRVCREPERSIFLLAPPSILLLGGLGALFKTYRVWRAGGVWPIWQGAGWALLVLMVVYITASAGILRS